MAIFDAPSGMTCSAYLQRFFDLGAPGELYNDDLATTDCQYCPVSTADEFLAASQIYWTDVWRNFGIGWAYIGFNVFAAGALYYLFRVKRPSKQLPKLWFAKMKHYVRVAGEWARTFFTSRFERTPSGKEHLNERIY